MIIVIRYIIYKDKYTKFNYFLDFKKIDFFFCFYLFYIYTEREREISLIIVILFLQFAIIFKIFYNICFWKKKMPNLNLHNIHLPCNLIFVFHFCHIIIFFHIYFLLLIFSENIILVHTFWAHNQFGPYILVTVNLIPAIFNLQSIWSLPLTH